MASEVKTNKISPATSTTVTLGDASDTFVIPASATLDVNGTIDVTGATTTGFPSSGFLGFVVYTADGTYTPGNTDNGTAGDEGNANVTKVMVEVQRAGGSGGRADANGAAMGGGAAGGYARALISMTNIDTCTVTVGDGGASQGSSNTAGNAGGLSKFEKGTGSGDFTDVIGNGGGGGVYSAYSRTAGGTATGGDINVQGGEGTSSGATTWGGSSQFGQGGSNLWTGQLTTSVASGYGSGGGGAYQLASAAGANGIVIIWEYA